MGFHLPVFNLHFLFLHKYLCYPCFGVYITKYYFAWGRWKGWCGLKVQWKLMWPLNHGTLTVWSIKKKHYNVSICWMDGWICLLLGFFHNLTFDWHLTTLFNFHCFYWYTGELAPPTGYLNEPTSNICATKTLNGCKSAWIHIFLGNF